jgi:outer membrane protein TolC
MVAPAASSPLSLSDCLRIALEQQPALIAHRASLAAAQVDGLDELRLAGLIERDLPIRKKQAHLGITIAQAGLDQETWQTIYAVMRTYYSVLYARQQLQVAREVTNDLQFYQQRVSEVVKKGESREWTTSTVDKITVYLRLAETRLADAERGIERATAALREAMGLPPGTPLVIPEESLPTPPKAEITKEQAEELALVRRGEMLQATTAARVVELEICAQESICGPLARSFAAFADIHARPIPQGISNTEYRPGAVSIEMPTFFAGPKSYRVDHARALSARAAAVVDKTRNLIALETEAAFFKWQDASSKVELNRDAAKSGARLVQHTLEDFRGGQQVRIEDILMNEVVAGQARAAYNESLYDQILALAALQRVTAGGFDPGLAPLPLPSHP